MQHSFDPDPLVEYESTMLRIELAVVSNGDGDDPTPADIPVENLVDIARENNVTVRSAGCEEGQDNSLVTAMEQGCDFFVPAPDQLGKEWNESITLPVTPLKADQSLTLTVEVEPVLFGPGASKVQLENPRIEVVAIANPRRQAYESLRQRAADGLTIRVNEDVWEDDEHGSCSESPPTSVSSSASRKTSTPTSSPSTH